LAISAFVLLEVEPGQVKEVANKLAELKGMENSCVVTGPYDIIGYLKLENIEDLGETVTNHIQTIPGIKKTLTCLCSYICACK